MPLIFYHPNGTFAGGASLHNLTLVVQDASVRQINEGVDESYSLSFAPDLSAATITAATIFGARHGLESFSQVRHAAHARGRLRGSEGPRGVHAQTLDAVTQKLACPPPASSHSSRARTA